MQTTCIQETLNLMPLKLIEKRRSLCPGFSSLELIFFLEDGVVLCFELRMKIMLTVVAEQGVQKVKDFSASHASLPARRLRAHKKLEGDTKWSWEGTTDTNRPEEYSIPCDIMLNNKSGGSWPGGLTLLRDLGISLLAVSIVNHFFFSFLSSPSSFLIKLSLSQHMNSHTFTFLISLPYPTGQRVAWANWYAELPTRLNHDSLKHWKNRRAFQDWQLVKCISTTELQSHWAAISNCSETALFTVKLLRSWQSLPVQLWSLARQHTTVPLPVW